MREERKWNDKIKWEVMEGGTKRREKIREEIERDEEREKREIEENIVIRLRE